MRKGCVRTLAVLSACVCAVALRAAARETLIFNEDDSHFFWRGKEKMTEAGLLEYLDEVLGKGAFTHFFMCPNAMRANFDSKAFEPIWKALEEDRDPGWWAEKAKLLHDRGIDPYAVWIRGCRARGVSPWITMRMNDCHFVHDRRFCSLSTFWRTHPEYWLKPSVETGKWRWEDRALDFSHRDVRDYVVSFAEELLERYDMDGLECDWMRFAEHLPQGREKEYSWCLDACMERIRAAARKAERRLGHPVRIGVRVDTRPDSALTRGTDVFTWARKRWIDQIVPCNAFNAIDFDLPYGEWRRRMDEANPDVAIVPGTDANVGFTDKTHRKLSIDEYCAWADRMYSQGAPGLYLFNLFLHPATNGVWRFVLDGGLAKESVSAHTKSIPANWRCEAYPTRTRPDWTYWRPTRRWRGVMLRGPLAEGDFRMLADWGFDFVRLPVKGRPLREIDEALALGKRYGLHVQLRFQTDPEEQKGSYRQGAWLAKRYRDIPNDALTFNAVLGAAIEAVHAEDPKRFVLLDGVNAGCEPDPAFFNMPLVGQAMRGCAPGPDSPAKFDIRPWKLAADRGEFCFVGEFGGFDRMPHERLLAWMEDRLLYFKRQGWGWCLCDMNGPSGFLDSGRKDVDYEDFNGHKLDRKLLELLRRY